MKDVYMHCFPGWYNFEPSLGLTKFTNTENITEYEYDITKDLDRMNLSTVLHRFT
jgi:hypothetical protein